jgi:hypothetical protein
MKMIVSAHEGSNGRDVEFTNTEMVAIRIPSQRAQAAPEKAPKPAARPTMPPTRCIHPQVLALVVIQEFALWMYEVPLTMPARPCSIQSTLPMMSSVPAKTAPPPPYADVLTHGSCSFWFQKRLATITAVVWTIVAPVLVPAGGRLIDESAKRRRRTSPAAGRELAVVSQYLDGSPVRNDASTRLLRRAVCVWSGVASLRRLLAPSLLDRVNNDAGTDPNDHNAGDHSSGHPGRQPSPHGGNVAEPELANTVTVKQNASVRDSDR